MFLSAPPYLHDLHSQMKFLMANAKAKNTNKTQNSYLKSWFRYCQLAKIPGCPVGGWHLAMYATSLVMGGKIKSADSIANYVSAVRSYHTDMGFNCPSPSQFGPLKRVIDGFRRLARRPIKRSLSITPTILVNFLITELAPPFCPIAFSNLITFKILSLFYFLTMQRYQSGHRVRTLTCDRTPRRLNLACRLGPPAGANMISNCVPKTKLSITT